MHPSTWYPLLQQTICLYNHLQKTDATTLSIFLLKIVFYSRIYIPLLPFTISTMHTAAYFLSTLLALTSSTSALPAFNGPEVPTVQTRNGYNGTLLERGVDTSQSAIVKRQTAATGTIGARQVWNSKPPQTLRSMAPAMSLPASDPVPEFSTQVPQQPAAQPTQSAINALPSGASYNARRQLSDKEDPTSLSSAQAPPPSSLAPVSIPSKMSSAPLHLSTEAPNPSISQDATLLPSKQTMAPNPISSQAAAPPDPQSAAAVISLTPKVSLPLLQERQIMSEPSSKGSLKPTVIPSQTAPSGAGPTFVPGPSHTKPSGPGFSKPPVTLLEPSQTEGIKPIASTFMA